ncbi:trans-sulfuration enzyme family protein [Niallia sp. 03133]|uniref:trans-sulfuration enzyme family protein n=1 Tax=Niallia sp. 03133 TaxID=3458060 RepID=UPI0040440377
MRHNKWSMDTKVIHENQMPDQETRAISSSITPAVAYAFPDVQTAAAVVAGEEEGIFYGRYGNPTLGKLEKKIASLEGGEDALGVASGMAAIATALLAFVKKDDHVLVTKDVYGGTYSFLASIAIRYGIQFDYVDCTDMALIKKSIKGNTKALFIETPSNPLLTILDMKKIAEVCKSFQIPLIVDNTFMTPYLQKPLEAGATIVVHSATKYINGHGDVLAGFIVGDKEPIHYMRKTLMGNLGQNLNAFDSYLILRGLKTMAVRMHRHCDNAMKVAEFLESHPSIKKVYYPGLPSHPQHVLAKKQMTLMGGIVSFEIDGDFQTATTFINSLKLAYISFSLGDPETLVQHPASMTHASIPTKEKIKFNISDQLIRLSLGLEDAQDIIDDIDQALSMVPVPDKITNSNK